MAAHGKNQLTVLSAKAKKTGRHLDGDGLYLVVDKSGARRWIQRLTINGSVTDLGLGGFGKVPLAVARAKSAALREIVATGGDPRRVRAKAKENQITFRQFADDWIENHKKEWSNEKHASQWKNTLATYAYPHIGDRFLDEIDTLDVLACVKPIWTEKAETASRVRGRIEAILDAAKALKLRTGDNPAVWAGGLEASLSKRNKKKTVEHHPAMPYRDIPAFLVALALRRGIGALALRFTILTAARTIETCGAQWDEIDFEQAVWVVPRERMKMRKEHHVPLSTAALALLGTMPRKSKFIFPSQKPGPDGTWTLMMSNQTMSEQLKGMGYPGDVATVHGMRSAFRDWAGEETNHAREVSEHALAHQLADESEAAYQRGTLFRKRRLLMQDWADYCTTLRETADVVSINKKATAT